MKSSPVYRKKSFNIRFIGLIRKAQKKIVQALQQHQNSQMGPKKLKITPKYPKIKMSETKKFSN